MRKNVRHTIWVVTLVALLAGCARDPQVWNTDGQALITLNLSLPHVNEAGATRAITATPGEENNIVSIDILALAPKGDEWVFDYPATNVTKVVDGNSVTVTATVKQMPSPQKFVIIANASAELTAAAPVRRENIKDIENRLVCTIGGGEWPARNNNTGSFAPIPMYAITSEHTISPEEDNRIGTFPMIRMLARIDVTLKSTINNFILEEACLFNYKTAGYVSYSNSGLTGTGTTAAVTTPAVPQAGDHSGDPIKRPQVMYLSDKSVNPRGTILNSIYTFESHAITSEEERTGGTALVVGGYYNGETENKSYYRIDLKTVDDSSNRISSGILRNHSYAVEIQSVSGAGYPTALEAYISYAYITAVIRDWNSTEQNITGGKQYYLNVSETSVKLTPEQNNTYTITAQTDYDTDEQGFPAGIQVDTEKITYSADGSTYDLPETPADGWLTVENTGTPTDAILVFMATGDITLDGKRFAKVRITAGNFTRIIDVERIQEDN